MFRDDETGDELTDALNDLVKTLREWADEVIRDGWWRRGEEPPDFEFNGELDNV